MARRLLTFASATSLLLLLGVIALWVRSYWASETVEWTRQWIKHGLTASHGTLEYHLITRQTLPFTDYYRPGIGHRTGLPTRSSYGTGSTVYWDRWQFRFITYTAPVTRFPSAFGSYVYFDVPCWALALALTPLPAWTIARSVRLRRRARDHRCLTCGYDLRATPTRCPECGTPIPPRNPLGGLVSS